MRLCTQAMLQQMAELDQQGASAGPLLTLERIDIESGFLAVLIDGSFSDADAASADMLQLRCVCAGMGDSLLKSLRRATPHH